MIISTDTERAFDKIQYPFMPFMIKTLSKVGVEGNFLSVIKKKILTSHNIKGEA